jgi:hypothetical protein
MEDIRGGDVAARDGLVGSVKDLYFDDERWAVRYLVVDTGNWLSGHHKVLISPASIPAQQSGGGYLRVALTREQVERAPGIDEDPPISRLLEEAHAQYYNYPYYWSGPYLWGGVGVPVAAVAVEQAQRPHARDLDEARSAAEQRARETHLRSSAEVVGYNIRALDGEIGHLEDFLVDDKSWAIREVVVDTRNWLPGKKVLVPPSAISDIDWAAKQVSVRLKREQLKQAPDAR